MKLVGVVAAASMLLAACGGGGSPAKQSTAAPGKPATVTVKNFEFAPGRLTVARGTTVTWKFEDNVQHNVTASSNAKFKSKDIQTRSYSYTFNSAGSYNYYCSIHQCMKGSVTVR